MVDGQMKILVFSDLHGDLESMQLLHEKIKSLGIKLDFVIFAGDFSNFFFQGLETIDVFPLILHEYEKFEVPVYYIRGNRDQNLQIRRVLPVDFEHAVSIEDKIVELENDLKIGGVLAGTIGELDIDENTILVTHDEPAMFHKGTLLHVAGHVHAARYTRNFMNAGFLFRTPDHNAKPMKGIFWILEIAKNEDDFSVKSINWYALEGKDYDTPQNKRRYPFKEYVCDIHPKAGTWVIPFYWKKCQWCYKEGR